MRKARVFVDGQLSGELVEIEKGKHYRFEYLPTYQGSSVSLEMSVSQLVYIEILSKVVFQHLSISPDFSSRLPVL